MGFLSKILGFLNGRKTTIGAALMLVGQLIPEASGIAEGAVPLVETLATQGGVIVASVGLIHKAVKAVL